MHIVECLTHSDPGGGQAVVFTLVKNLHRLHPEHRYTIILPSGGAYVDIFRGLGISVVEFPFDAISPGDVFRVNALLRQIRPDIVHSHGKGAGLYTRLFSRPWGTIHSYHGFHPPAQYPARMLYMQLEKALLRHTDAVANVSDSERASIGSHFPSSERKLCVIPNIIDVQETRQRATEALPSSVDAFLNRVRGHFVVTMIARDDPAKNVPLALATAARVLAGNAQAAFLFIGMDARSHERQTLLQKYDARLFMIPFLHNTAPAIARSHVVMLTSKREGSPLVVLEAFALGKPVVGTDVDGIRDLVRQDVNGLLCGESPDAIAKALEKSSADPKMYDHLSAGATVSGNAQHLDPWVEVYHQLYTRTSIRK